MIIKNDQKLIRFIHNMAMFQKTKRNKKVNIYHNFIVTIQLIKMQLYIS